ncbi:MAG TPA: hypothetical protein VFQ53_13940 [Kofleriaceae bacterium]|nr:hypothetical protein [Kofleriaceae bacterium]
MTDRDHREVGQSIGDFVIEEALPANVSPLYRCRGPHGERAAVKVVDVAAATHRVCGMPVSPERLAAHEATFVDETARLAALAHPNLARVIGAGHDFVAIEWLEGCSLDRLLGTPWPFARVRRLAIGVIDALALLHDHGLVHGDVWPENLFVVAPDTAAEKLVLLDVVGRHPSDRAIQEEGRKQTRTGWSRPGSWASARYQYPRRPSDAETPVADTFCIALVLVEMIAGRPLVQSESAFGALAELWQGTWSMPPEVDATPWGPAIRRAISANPGERFADARALLAALTD